jgi:hypothetical protein
MSTAATIITTIATSHTTALAGPAEVLGTGAVEEVTGSSLSLHAFRGLRNTYARAYYHGPVGKEKSEMLGPNIEDE